MIHTKYTMSNSYARVKKIDTHKMVEEINNYVNTIITTLKSHKIPEEFVELINEERNNVTIALNLFGSIQKIDNKSWNQKLSRINTLATLKSLNAIISKIMNEYKLAPQPPPQLQQPLAPPPPLQQPLAPPLIPPLSQPLTPLLVPPLPQPLAPPSAPPLAPLSAPPLAPLSAPPLPPTEIEIIYICKNELVWIEKLESVKKYMNDKKKRPLDRDKDNEVIKLAAWINSQQQNYKHNIKLMKKSNIKKLWEDFINDEKYKIYFTCRKEVWILQFELVKKYIDENKKSPSQSKYIDKDGKKLGKWINKQKENYKNKTNTVYNDIIIRYLWEDFINEYKIYFK